MSKSERIAEEELSNFLNSIPQPQSYDSLRAGLQAEQASMTRAEIAQRAASGSLPIGQDAEGQPIFAPAAEAVFDPETAVPPEHKWVDRGLIMSCEGAGHANHRHFKIKARR